MYSYSQIVQSEHFVYIFWSTCIRTPKLFNRGTFYTFFGVHVFVLPNCSIGALSIHFLEYMYSYSQIVQLGHFLYIFSSTRTHSPKLFNWGTLYTFSPPKYEYKNLTFSTTSNCINKLYDHKAWFLKYLFPHPNFMTSMYENQLVLIA
jgi:hypothetical protein